MPDKDAGEKSFLPEQNAQSKRRRAREYADSSKDSSADPGAFPVSQPAIPPVPLDAMLGQGVSVKFSGRVYEMAPITLGKIKEAQELLNQWPQVLFFAGLIGPAPDGSMVDAEKVAGMLTAANSVLDDTAETVTADEVYMAFAHLSASIADDEISAIAELIALSLRRRHPEVTAEMIIADLDIPDSVRMLRTLFAVNTGLRDRFGKP